MSLDLASQVLELVRAAGLTGEADVYVERETFALTRFANSFIHQNVADDTTTVWLRLHADGRTVATSTTNTTPDGLRTLVSNSAAAVKHAPADPGWPGLTPPAPLAGEPGFDEATADADPAERAERVRAFVAATGGLTAAGYCRTRRWEVSYANTAGQAVTSRSTEAAIDGVARHQGSDGVARQASVRLADLDGALLGTRAAAKARAGVDPVELPPGRYEVVFEPTAVADLLENLAIWGFNGKALAERQTFVELGAAQFDPSVTIVDDPFASGSPGLAFDAEGTPKRRLVLVDAGVTTAVVHDRRTAKLLGGDAVSTGHALLGGGGLGAIPVNPGLLPGTGSSPGAGDNPVVDPAAAGLIGAVERGLLVTDLWYTRVLDPKTLAMTGLTRNGVWLIEDGKVAAPVQNLRFTQSYPQALRPGAVKAIGPVAVVLPGELVPRWSRAPALHLAEWNFTGNASG
ncbi:MAG TPA: TldD/PmbA family protein [Natronosporangium sp.]